MDLYLNLYFAKVNQEYSIFLSALAEQKQDKLTALRMSFLG